MSARNLRIRTERLQADCATRESDERVEAVTSSGPASCSTPRWPLPAKAGCPVGSEEVRARLIGEISRIVREPVVPEPTRMAALELIGWLARRFPGETPHALGVDEAVRAKTSTRGRTVEDEAPASDRSGVRDADAQSERRLSAARRRPR
jgi:hypothetical protein